MFGFAGCYVFGGLCFCLMFFVFVVWWFVSLFGGMFFCCGVFAGELCWPVCLFVLFDCLFLIGEMFRLAVLVF